MAGWLAGAGLASPVEHCESQDKRPVMDDPDSGDRTANGLLSF
ncbi:hypothetical protein [Leptolyngbya iicbica]|nr:hypothetical protein [Leptolyngbya sp. LK]